MSKVVYRTPVELLGELGIRAPEEIDVEVVAAHLGATVVYEPLRGCAARLLGYGDRAIITVDQGAPPPRRRFSAAHELGHWMCDRGRVAFACTELVLATSWDGTSPERRANAFATDLLLPAAMFKPRVQKREPSLAACGELARQFETSLTATALRLVELGPRVAVAICTERGQRRWVRRSADLPPGIKVRPVPGRETGAAKHANGEPCEEGPFQIGADEWFDHPVADEYEVLEDACEIAQGVVLTLVWWRDERMLRDLGWP